MKENEWHKIEDKNDLPWEDGVYEFRDKDGEIEEVNYLLPKGSRLRASSTVG